MARFVLVITSAAHPGRDDEYNAWYDGTHLRDVLAIPGVVSGRRFEAERMAGEPAPAPGPYLAIYEIEADDPATVLAELRARGARGEMPVSPALDPSSAAIWVYRAR